MPLIGAFIKDPNAEHILLHTGWDPDHNDGKMVPLVRQDGTPIRPEDVSVGGQMTVYPGIPGGATNEYADSPTLLIHLREADAELLRQNIALAMKNNTSPPVVQGMWENFVAYLEDLHPCRLPGQPLRAADQPAALPVPPVAIRDHRHGQADLRSGAPQAADAAARRWRAGFFVAKSDFLEAIGPTTGSGRA